MQTRAAYVVILLAGVAAVAAYLGARRVHHADVVIVGGTPPGPADMQLERQVIVYFLQPDSAKLLGVLRPLNRGEVKEEAALDALLAGPRPDEGLVALIPKGTTVLGIRRDGPLVTVNLNRTFSASFPEGSEMGYLTVASIVATLTSLEGVQFVAFEIEGKPVRSLGQVDLSEPLPQDRNVLVGGQ